MNSKNISKAKTNKSSKALSKVGTRKSAKLTARTKKSTTAKNLDSKKVQNLVKEIEKDLGGKSILDTIADLQQKLDLKPAYRVAPDVHDPLAVRAPDGQRYHAGDRESAWYISRGRPDLAFA